MSHTLSIAVESSHTWDALPETAHDAAKARAARLKEAGTKHTITFGPGWACITYTHTITGDTTTLTYTDKDTP